VTAESRGMIDDPRNRGGVPITTKPSIPESVFQRQVIDLALLLGWRVAHFHDSRREVRPGKFVGDTTAAGFPDLVLARDRIIYAELKREKGKPTRAQREWLDALRAAGGEAYLWRPSDWPQVQAVLAARPPSNAGVIALAEGLREATATAPLNDGGTA
jgi:hypothetical protein